MHKRIPKRSLMRSKYCTHTKKFSYDNKYKKMLLVGIAIKALKQAAEI